MTPAWLPLPGFGARWEVSRDGEVRDRASLEHAERRISYLGPYVRLRSRWIHVAEIVLRAHFGEPWPDEHPIHEDGNLLNNDIANLRWSFDGEEPEFDEVARQHAFLHPSSIPQRGAA